MKNTTEQRINECRDIANFIRISPFKFHGHACRDLLSIRDFIRTVLASDDKGVMAILSVLRRRNIILPHPDYKRFVYLNPNTNIEEAFAYHTLDCKQLSDNLLILLKDGALHSVTSLVRELNSTERTIYRILHALKIRGKVDRLKGKWYFIQKQV